MAVKVWRAASIADVDVVGKDWLASAVIDRGAETSIPHAANRSTEASKYCGTDRDRWMELLR